MIFDTVDYELLKLIGRKRGFCISGGEIDTERTANMLLDVLNNLYGYDEYKKTLSEL